MARTSFLSRETYSALVPRFHLPQFLAQIQRSDREIAQCRHAQQAGRRVAGGIVQERSRVDGPWGTQFQEFLDGQSPRLRERPYCPHVRYRDAEGAFQRRRIARLDRRQEVRHGAVVRARSEVRHSHRTGHGRCGPRGEGLAVDCAGVLLAEEVGDVRG